MSNGSHKLYRIISALFTDSKMEIRFTCRVCLNQKSELHSLYDFDISSKLTLYEKLNTCTGINIEISNDLPYNICSYCLDLLNAAYEFRDLWEKSEKKLQYEKSISEMKMEPVEFVQIVEDEINNDKVIDNFDYFIDVDQNYEESNYVIENLDPVDTTVSEYEASSDVNNVITEEPVKVLKYTKKTKATKEKKIFICDQCGNTYDQMCKLQGHLRIHRNFRPHNCEFCPKKFTQSCHLIVHMRTHTGEKPLKCKYCPRKFGDHSTKIRHERTHTNERPYVCEICAMAFVYAHSLKKHQVIHTGEKLFRCEPCEKVFPQKHNLKNHWKTLTHKEMEAKALSRTQITNAFT